MHIKIILFIGLCSYTNDFLCHGFHCQKPIGHKVSQYSQYKNRLQGNIHYYITKYYTHSPPNRL